MYTRLVGKRRRVRWLVPFCFLVVVCSTVVLSKLYRYPMSVFHRFPRQHYDAVVADAAARHCIAPALLKSVIWCESRFDANAVGSKGEVGLMQVRPRNGAVEEWAKVHDVPPPRYGLLFNPGLNVEIGAWYLGRALRKWRPYKNRVALALSEYNAGAAGMTPWIPRNSDDEVVERITIASTRRYVRTILARYKEAEPGK